MSESDLCGTCGAYFPCEHKANPPRALPETLTWAGPLTDAGYANLIVAQANLHDSPTNDSWSSRDGWATSSGTAAWPADVLPSTKKTSTS